jgi:hypothetical protein
MAADDFAILTGISVYPNPGYTRLDGPPNDLELVRTWLTDPAGGAVPPERVIVLQTPLPFPNDVDPDIAPPLAEEFDRHFKKLLRERMKLGPQRVSGRLYLYFSGHGFCNRSQDKPSEAALYAANATREAYEHIFGTHYARIAKAWALFAEVVLVMDCCRDSEVARVPTPKPYRDSPDDDLAADVRVLSIYATPKGGKAQERPIAERGNKVHGLLTHGLFKLLDELPPSDDAKGIAATDLRRHLWEAWSAITGADGAPRPEIILPSNGEIYFPAKNRGSAVDFLWSGDAPPGWRLTLRNDRLDDIARIALDGNGSPLLAPGGVISHTLVPQRLTVRLPQGLYAFETSAPAPRSGNFKVDGSHASIQL